MQMMSIVLNDKGETWGWDGNSMTKLAANGPTGFGLAMAYDPVRKIVLAYGGFGPERTAFPVLWELDRGQWEKITDNGRWQPVAINQYKYLDEENVK